MADQVVTGTLTRSEAQIISIETTTSGYTRTVSTLSTEAELFPQGVAVDSAGNVYVAESNKHRINKITPDGTVDTLAGRGTAAYLDGQGMSARFNTPTGVAVDSAGTVYVADDGNHRIRKITPGGTVSTLAGSGTAGYAEGTGTSAQFNQPRGVAVDSAGNVYVADDGNHRIRKITPGGTVSTLAGSGTAGYAEGTGTNAQFNNPRGIAVDSAGNVYVGDQMNHRIRKITPGGTVSTLAGTGTYGNVDGPGTSAKFNRPYGVAVDSAGNVYVAGNINQRIRKITPDGTVSTLAGSGTLGYLDGPGSSAQFNQPRGVAVDSAGNVYVADTYNNLIRKITFVSVSGISGRQCSCSSGRFWDFSRKECTTQCPVATYADSSSITCQPCPANKTSVAGSTSVSQCICSYASPYWSGTSCMQQLNPTTAVTVSGSGITTRYVNKYVVHEFTQAASFVVHNPIIANILLVGGGAGGTSDGKPGNGGDVITLSNQTLTNGTYNMTIGAGGGPNTTGGCTFFSK
jgi:sugar lactone lactonase YvrE